jgi:cell division protein FtsI/penicillin-binding protein 2
MVPSLKSLSNQFKSLFPKGLPKQGRIRFALLTGIVSFVIIIVWNRESKTAGLAAAVQPPDGAATVIPAVNPWLQGFPHYQSLRDTVMETSRGQCRFVTTRRPELENKIYKRLQEYRPRLGGVVALDPNTGRVLALVNFRNPPEAGGDLPRDEVCLHAGFPAASIFKIVSAACALEMEKANPASTFAYNGRNYTLYKSQLDGSRNRWTREITLGEAFARSINPVFGLVGQRYLKHAPFLQFCENLGFNGVLPFDFLVDSSRVRTPEDDYGWAELASGYNRQTKISPLHGALLASAAATDGVLHRPYLLDSVLSDRGEVLYAGQPREWRRAFSPATARNLRNMMSQTVRIGTARRSFWHLTVQRKYQDLEFGGKTGSLNTYQPDGRTDWFAGYARAPDGRQVAVCVFLLHGKFWTVHAAYIAAETMRYFMEDTNPASKQLAAAGVR